MIKLPPNTSTVQGHIKNMGSYLYVSVCIAGFATTVWLSAIRTRICCSEGRACLEKGQATQD